MIMECVVCKGTRTWCKMDSFEAAKVVHERILQLEPEPVTRKIVGYVYLQEYPNQEMIRLALGPDKLIDNLVKKAKVALQLAPTPASSSPVSLFLNRTRVLDPSFQCAHFHSGSPKPRVLPPRLARYWDHQLVTEQQQVENLEFMALDYSGSHPEDHRFPAQFMGPEDQIEPLNAEASRLVSDCSFADTAFSNLSSGDSQNMQTALVPVKACHYFNKGFCKHGSNCRYLHGESVPENYSDIFGSHPNEFGNEDQEFSPRSLERLELEIAALLKSRRGNPISIASLPMLYYEKYGRTLQAEGYLTESQRHGKAHFSLTKLLARLKSIIQLIDRPHGQHAVILAEDAPKYLGSQSERNYSASIFSSLHQIYLTFPAESAFTEEDISNYFSAFGPVQDVRIPCQQKRMFGFVTFFSSNTVKIVLAKGNPHYVCGSRVLVKPYREKSKLVERKYYEKLEPLMNYPPHHMDINSELEARSLRERLMEEHKKALELEMKRLSNLKLERMSLRNDSYFGYSMDKLKVSEDHVKLPSPEQFNYLLNVLNSVPSTDDHLKNSEVNYTDQESTQGLSLPDRSFASVVASSVSAI